MTAWTALLLLAAATATPVANAQAQIVNSGSTNTRGYALTVSRSGAVLVDAQDGTGARSAAVEPDLANRFFAALEGSEPLDALTPGRCMKSASFGYAVRVRYSGAVTPDLTCPADDRVKTLATLAFEIASSVHVSNFAMRRRLIPAPQSS